MGKIIEGKPTKADFQEALILAGIKSATERIESPFIGNGTIKSGIVKGIIGYAIPWFAGSNRWANRIATAHVIDATEDIVNGVINLLGGGAIMGSETNGMVI